jgi:type IV secretory pathway TraG/TraD family ATPase VirD4
MTNKAKRLRGLLGAFGIALSALINPGHATAAILAPCTLSGETYSYYQDPAKRAEAVALEKQQCGAQNAIYATWESKLSALDVAQQDLRTAADARNWKAYGAKWAATLPLLKELQAAALAHRQTTGAMNVVTLYGADIGYFLQNVGLGMAGDLDSASAKIVAGLDGSNAAAAATAGLSIVQQSETRGIDFVRGLAQDAKASAQAAKEANLIAKGAERQDQMTGGSVAGYVGGFGTRFGMFRGIVIEWTIIATILSAFFGFSTKRPRVVVKMPIIALAVLVPVWLFHVFLPFLPGWLEAIIAFFVGVGLWTWTEKLPEPWAQVFHTSKVGRPSAADLAGGALRAFAAGNAATAAPAGTPPVMPDSKDTHGSARWGSVGEMQAGAHLLPAGKSAGFDLARVVGAPTGVDQRFRFVGHVVTVAPTGSGKGIGAVIPNLLTYPGSCLVLDVKGENAAVTARARRELGNKVFIVDPFGVTKGETHAFNLLDRIDPTDPECVSESATLADCLVIGETKGDGAHFDESAKTLLQGLMLHIAALANPTKRTLGELRRLITAAEDTLLGTLADMAADESVAFGIPARAANTLMGMADKERGSVLSTARRHTAFLDDPRIADTLSRSDFNMANIKTELMTVYLVLPANKIGANARFVRGFIGSVIAAITSSSVQPMHRVAFLLDEFGQLGYMKAIEDAVSLLRGYGLSFWVFIQDLSQLKGVYPKWQTFLANSAKTFYGIDDYDTAKYVSDSLGQATIEYETQSEGKNQGSGLSGGGSSLNRGKSAGTSQQFAGRHLLTPDEVMRLGPERPIVLLKGEYPYQLTRLNYLTDKEYEGRADSNPYHA